MIRTVSHLSGSKDYAVGKERNEEVFASRQAGVAGYRSAWNNVVKAR